MHQRLADQLAKCPKYYNAVADEYVSLIDRMIPQPGAMDTAFGRIMVPAAADIDALTLPTATERMLVRELARVPSV